MTALRFQTGGGDIRHPQPPFEGWGGGRVSRTEEEGNTHTLPCDRGVWSSLVSVLHAPATQCTDHMPVFVRFLNRVGYVRMSVSVSPALVHVTSAPRGWSLVLAVESTFGVSGDFQSKFLNTGVEYFLQGGKCVLTPYEIGAHVDKM